MASSPCLRRAGTRKQLHATSKVVKFATPCGVFAWFLFGGGGAGECDPLQRRRPDASRKIGLLLGQPCAQASFAAFGAGGLFSFFLFFELEYGQLWDGCALPSQGNQRVSHVPQR